MNRIAFSIAGLSMAAVFAAQAESVEAGQISMYELCLLKKIQTANKSETVESIRQYCLKQQAEQMAQNSQVEGENQQPLANREFGALSNRIISERLREFDPFVIIPHRMNYILPAYGTSSINRDAYGDVVSWSDNLTDVEAKFQLSLKVPINEEPIFRFGDGVYFAFTVEAWWQVYSDQISKPFRETNYRPEFFYLTPLPFKPFGGNAGMTFGVEHQSNGRSQVLSRSWNRFYASFLWEKGNFALNFQPWWRVPEDEDEFPGDPKGDDNPDIADYMGHFELYAAYTWDDYELNLMTRQNFATNKGAVELGVSFPLWGRLRGYSKIFSGYGESLIDYNHSQTRFGIGLALTDILN